jgi:hypothetical protein
MSYVVCCLLSVVGCLLRRLLLSVVISYRVELDQGALEVLLHLSENGAVLSVVCCDVVCCLLRFCCLSPVRPLVSLCFVWFAIVAAALGALEEVYAALSSDRGVRNVCAYFTGIARKYLDPTHAPPQGGPSQIYGEGVPAADDAFASLQPRVGDYKVPEDVPQCLVRPNPSGQILAAKS